MTALALLAALFTSLWFFQTIMFRTAGLQFRWRIATQDVPNAARLGSRIATQAGIALVILVYPWLSVPAELPGHGPSVSCVLTAASDYYAGLFPAGRAARGAILGFLAAVLFLALLYLAWAVADNVRFSVRHKPKRLARKLLPVPFSAALGATVEELLFRGVVLADLLRTLSPPVAVAVGGMIFAIAHYVREVKRRWTFPGHVVLGLVLCFAFVRTGSLWLPIGLHAGGIFAIMAARPFVRYEGPAWVTGASIFPFAGVVGIVALIVLVASVV